MKRIILLNYTGSTASNLKVATRLSRKIRAIQRNEECVLIDCEDVEPSEEFLDVLLINARPEKVKFCGLPIMRQITMALRMREGEERA